ncbi:hypothetical protein COLO4_12110 [Corchorus olitorius]|uniref:DOG1 domain-containing protein n=1 Tax=Corchorus olitorius TaxID=93759 RepID=A0A1R3K245_9ROSI|nr:hypothetical protein COLO4_12110 [Corchorus olitorius]
METLTKILLFVPRMGENPGNAKYLEKPYDICDPYSNPQSQELVQILPHPEWAVHGYPEKKGDGWIGDSRTWELDVGALSSRLYFYQDPGTKPARRIWSSLNVGTEIYVSRAGETAEWTVSDFDVLVPEAKLKVCNTATIAKMSELPSSASYMASAIQNSSAPQSETFKTFFECWIGEQNQFLEELVAASDQQQGTRDEESLRRLVERVTEHYELYYKAKARWGKLDVLAMLSPSWTSKFEDAFLWIGGWRPSMAFHLVYSKSGLQLEDQFVQLLRGLGRGDLGDLSPGQFSRINELQAKTIKEEKKVSEKMAKLQETVADSSMVELSHLASEMMRRRGSAAGEVDGGEEHEKERVMAAVESKEEGLQKVLQKADNLRLKTLKAVIEILSPIQAVHFLIAAAELHLRIHEWGKQRDADKKQHLLETASAETQGSCKNQS